MLKMEMVLKTHGVCSNRLLDIGTLPPEETSIVAQKLQEVFSFSPLPKLISSGVLEFFIEPSAIDCICLYDSFLHLQISVVKINARGKEEPLARNDDISPINFLGQTLFSQLFIYINDELINEMNSTYGYEATILSLMHLSEDVQNSYLKHAMWEPTTAGAAWITSKMNPGIDAWMKNRSLQIENSAIVSLTSPILHSLFLVPRVLPPNIELRLVFSFNSPEFCLLAPAVVEESAGQPPVTPTAVTAASTETGKREKRSNQTATPHIKYNIKIHGAKLYLQKYRLSPQALQRQHQIMERTGALYPVGVLNTIVIPVDKGSQSVSKTLIIGGAIPRMAYVAQVERDAFYGSLHKCPFDF
ncbi:MAG: hypothetical protein GY853_06860 [PVC group bacterium]|nr:hypothetical protein [PVC group bacterium]